MTTCPQCHFVYEDHDAAGLPTEIRHAAREIRERLGNELALADGLERLRRRITLERWSALEYAAHVRDVLLAQRERLYLALVVDTPSFAPIHRDVRAVLARYNEDDPATTGTEVALAADMFTRALENLDEEQWARRCMYNFPEPTNQSLLWMGQHTLHEAVHHLADIDEDLAEQR